MQALKAEHSDELTRIQAHYEQKQRYFVAELKKKQANASQEISDAEETTTKVSCSLNALQSISLL